MTVFNVGYSEISEVWGDLTKKKKKKTQQDPMCDLYEMKGNSSAYSETDLINYNYDKSRYQRPMKDKPIKMHVDVNKDQDNYESKQLPNSLFENQFDVRHPEAFEMEDPKDYMVRACSAPKRSDKPDRVYDDEVVRMKQKGMAPPPTDDEEEEVYQEYYPPRQTQQESREYYDEDEHDYAPPRQERRTYTYSTASDTEDETYDEYIKKYKAKKKKKSAGFVYLDILLYVLSGIILIFLLEQFVKIGINMQQI